MTLLRVFGARLTGLALAAVLVAGCGIAANDGAAPTVAITP